MRIVHFAPFAPNGCGMYEAARDMIVADFKAGHESVLVDVGATTLDNTKTEPKENQKDPRGEVTIVSAPPGVVLDADVAVMHTGVPDNWLVKCQVPLIVILHGRPAACFVTEMDGHKVSYSLMAELASWPRVKALVTFWQSHVPFWGPIIPDDKLVCFKAPPVDEKRFCPEGPKYDFAGKIGKHNVVMADTWREDVNTYEVVSGIVEAAKKVMDTKFHLFAMNDPMPNCWEYLLNELKEADALGVVWGRKDKMEEVYRGADIVISPQRIATRSVSEPLCCGVPVIADLGCDYATYQVDMHDPYKVAEGVERAIFDLDTYKDVVAKSVKKSAEAFYLANYSNEMNTVYLKVQSA